MVGVPGRSKGCLTCRKRRKGCDLAKPTCAVCEKAGLQCGGYGTQRVFVVSTPRSRHAGYSVSAGLDSSTSSWQCSPPKQDTVAGDITNLHLLARPEYERRCIDLFWEAYFPSGRPLPAAISRSYTCTWTETARKLYREDDPLRYALWANCLIMTGQRHGTVWMLREGPRMYGRALAGLGKALGRAQGARRDASIATVKLLGMFEAFWQQSDEQPPDQDQHWQRHHDGELALFVARTPVAHISGDAHHVFADERVEMALSALLRRKQMPLSTPEWKAVPWQQIPKDLKDVLVDVLVDMPGLVEQFDKMQLCPDASSQAALREDLTQKCWEHDRQLLNWLGVVSQLGSPPGEPGSDDLRVVTEVAQVHGMSLFFTTGLVLYSILRTVSGSEADLPQRADPMHYARKLTEAIAILLQPSAGLYGLQSAVLPLEVALRYTEDMGLLSDAAGPLMERLRRLKGELKDGLAGTVNTGLRRETGQGY